MSRIIIIGPAYPLRGGIANFNEALCRALNSDGDNCSITSFSLQYPGFLFPGTTQFAGDDPAPVDLSIATSINSINPLSWIKAASAIAREKPDLVVIRYWLPFMAPCLGTMSRLIRKKLKNVRIVAIADNVIPHESRPGDKILTRYFVKSCHAFLVMSNSVLNDLRLFDTVKPAVMHPHPVYNIFGPPIAKKLARKSLGLDENEKIVLFFGFIRRYKGLDLLINAFADKRIRESGVKLLIAGEFYEDKVSYITRMDELGLRDTIMLHDFYIPREQVAVYFCAADLVAQPYRDATQSGVTQIAYHFEKPMLVTDVGGLPEIVPHLKAGYVTGVSANAIADAIFDFYSNKRETALIEGVREKAGDFTWESFVKALKNL